MADANDEPASPARPGRSRFRPTTVRGLMKLVLICGLVFGGLVFIYQGISELHRPGAYRAQCINNLKQIALALNIYQASQGCLPPAVVTDGRGKPMHSWRVLILPYLEQKSLYDSYNFEEPWDSPHNRLLIPKMPGCYTCPWQRDWIAKGQTSYFAIVGPGLIFPGPDRSVSLDAIPDGAAETILVVESQSLSVPWTEPRDLDFSRMSLRVNDTVLPSISGQHLGGANVARADGGGSFLKETTPSETIRAWLTINGGETIPEVD